MEFKCGLQVDGYIYGYLFGSKEKVILDTGPVEYRVLHAEVWNGSEYVQCDEFRLPQMVGNRARVKDER